MTSMVNILHIINDQKFVPYCKRTFDLSFINNSYATTGELRATIASQKFDIIVMHYLLNESIPYMASYESSTPVVWFFWGADGFTLGKFHNHFLLPKTQKSKIQLAFKNSFIFGLRLVFKNLFPFTIDLTKQNQMLLKAINNVSLIVPIVPQDYDILSKFYKINPPQFHLNYLSPIFDNTDLPLSNGNNILLGNSSNFTNNHIDAIDAISTLNLADRKVYIPLSYGSKQNVSYVKHYAQKKLGTNGICLMDFLPFSEYQKIIQSCSIVIMNHLQQEALGNIIQALLMGCSIYLQPSSSLHQFLKEENFIIFPIKKNITLATLTDEEKEINKNNCIRVFGRKKQHDKVRQLINTLLPGKLIATQI